MTFHSRVVRPWIRTAPFKRTTLSQGNHSNSRPSQYGEDSLPAEKITPRNGPAKNTKSTAAMDLKIGAVVVLLFIYLRIQSVSSLKCHVCSSVNPGEKDCGEVKPSDTKYLMSCSGPANASCRIQEQWVEFEILRQKHEKRTIRQCATTPFDATRACYYRAGFGGKVNVCNCVGDGCNGAATLGTALATLLATLGAAMLFRFV